MLTAALAAILLLSCLIAAGLHEPATPAGTHRRQGLARIPLSIQVALVALIASAVINHAHPGAIQ